MSQERFRLVAAISLVVANVVPAFRLAGDLVWGFQASLYEFLAIPMSVTMGLEGGQLPAAVLGIVANLGFLAAFMAYASPVQQRIAVISAVSAFASVGCLATGEESFVPYPGCLLWLATGVLLVLGAFADASTAQEGSPPNSDKSGG